MQAQRKRSGNQEERRRVTTPTYIRLEVAKTAHSTQASMRDRHRKAPQQEASRSLCGRKDQIHKLPLSQSMEKDSSASLQSTYSSRNHYSKSVQLRFYGEQHAASTRKSKQVHFNRSIVFGATLPQHVCSSTARIGCVGGANTTQICLRHQSRSLLTRRMSSVVWMT